MIQSHQGLIIAASKMRSHVREMALGPLRRAIRCFARRLGTRYESTDARRTLRFPVDNSREDLLAYAQADYAGGVVELIMGKGRDQLRDSGGKRLRRRA